MLNDSFKITYQNVPVAISRQKGSAHTALHNHGEFEMLLITGGISTVSIGESKYNAQKGDLLFVNPMEVHSVTVDEKESYSHKCICFDCSLLTNKKFCQSIKSGNIKVNHIISESKDLTDCFKKVFRIIEAKESAYDMEATAYINIIFSNLIKNEHIEKSQANPKNIDFCADILEYVKEHFAEDLTSNAVAEKLSFNHSYFCRKFKKNFGTSFSNYLTSYRISVSTAMLSEGNKSIADVAFACGFSTPQYFSKCFKKAIGILPNQYKAKSQ